MSANRTVLKIAGENGMGLSSVGEMVQKALKKNGFNIRSEREFPSTIKGGKACNIINFSSSKIYGLSKTIDIAIGLDREGVKDCLETLKPGGILIHGFDRWNKSIKNLPQIVESKKLQVFLLPARDIALENGGSVIMVNTVLLGFLWKVLGLDIDSLRQQIKVQFQDKSSIINVNITCAQAGFEYNFPSKTPSLSVSSNKLDSTKQILIDGNTSLALGAIQAGVRAYYAYPMSPSTSILVYLAKVSHQTKMLVKQAEDEITAAQMALGSMHMGTRALVATSGGGFDLMTETVSLSGMIETPLVITIVQRPGPATGLPTWTAQSDLDLAIYSAHGEFCRIVLACSDATSSFENIQHALNLSEKYQIPVILLSEATIGMGYETTPEFTDNTIPIERGIITATEEIDALQPSDRYQITSTGVSKRWLPGKSKSTYFANGDEHWEEGEITEDEQEAGSMIKKRLIKTKTILDNLPEPEIFGDPMEADISFIGWGSSKGPMLDSIEILAAKNIKANYLHFNYILPLKTAKLIEFCKQNQNVSTIEGNFNGQLSNLIESKTNLKFPQRLLKWNGRPFYVEDIVDFVREKVNKT
ncbi:MAG: 2-oxoacid:acceptor oxidoreductase subunit alpha [Patescibacteria group bacterium]